MSARRGAATAAALVAALLLVALGVWQLERRAWKHALVARVEAKLAAAPVAPPTRAVGQDDAYTRLVLTGRWRATRPVLVKAVTDLGAGWWVLNALDTPAGTIVVNRGFVPDAARDALPVASGLARVTGLLRLTEPGGAFLRDNDPAADRWYSRDVAAIAAARALPATADYFIDADAGTQPDALPVGGLTVIRFPNNHLVYALTWFSLAAMVAGAYILLMRQSRRP